MYRERLIREAEISNDLADARLFGFDVLGEGGSYNTFVTDAPFFEKRIDILDYDTLWDDATRSGYMDVRSAKLVDK